MKGQTDKMDHSQEEDEEERVQRREKSEGLRGQMRVSGGGCTPDNALSYSIFFHLRSCFKPKNLCLTFSAFRSTPLL